MSGEDFALIALAETTKEYVKPVQTVKTFVPHGSRDGDVHLEKGSFFRRAHNLRFKLPSMSRFRNRLQKMSCFKTEEDETLMMEIPRHKSIDIGVGFARRMSLFLFTKRSVCVHPYHPFTPQQTTRKFFMPNGE